MSEHKAVCFAGMFAVFACALFTGCTGGPSGVFSTGTVTGADAAQIKSERSGRVFAAAPEPSSSTWAYQTTGFGLIREPQVERYLQSILIRLLDHWHGEKPERVGVFIESGDGVNAKATPSGDILIPIGGFDLIKSEDELAALIGHELGHVLLKHRESEKQASQLATVATTAVGVVFAASSIGNGGMRKYGNTREFYVKDPRAVERDTMRAIAVQQSLITVSQDILLTAYSREHEYQADIFGLRLAGQAGWDPGAILNLTERWQDAELTEQKKREDAIKDAPGLQGLTQSVGLLAAEIIKSHPNAGDRRDNIAKDIQISFKDLPPREPLVAPYSKTIETGAFAKKRQLWRVLKAVNEAIYAGHLDDLPGLIKKAENMPGSSHPDSRLIIVTAMEMAQRIDLSTSLRLLSTADLKQPATRNFYDKLAIRYAHNGQFDEARRAATLGESYYGRLMLPVRLAILRYQISAASDGYKREVPRPLLEESGVLQGQCDATGDNELIEQCRVASSGVSEDMQYQNCGGLVTALAALAPGAQGRCGGQQDAKASAPGVPASAAGGAGSGNIVNSIVGGILGTN